MGTFVRDSLAGEQFVVVAVVLRDTLVSSYHEKLLSYRGVTVTTPLPLIVERTISDV